MTPSLALAILVSDRPKSHLGPSNRPLCIDCSLLRILCELGRIRNGLEILDRPAIRICRSGQDLRVECVENNRPDPFRDLLVAFSEREIGLCDC